MADYPADRPYLVLVTPRGAPLDECELTGAAVFHRGAQVGRTQVLREAETPRGTTRLVLDVRE